LWSASGRWLCFASSLPDTKQTWTRNTKQLDVYQGTISWDTLCIVVQFWNRGDMGSTPNILPWQNLGKCWQLFSKYKTNTKSNMRDMCSTKTCRNN
jgi:hypothetical protein